MSFGRASLMVHWSMYAKYEVSISHGSKFIAKVKADR